MKILLRCSVSVRKKKDGGERKCGGNENEKKNPKLAAVAIFFALPVSKRERESRGKLGPPQIRNIFRRCRFLLVSRFQNFHGQKVVAPACSTQLSSSSCGRRLSSKKGL